MQDQSKKKNTHLFKKSSLFTALAREKDAKWLQESLLYEHEEKLHDLGQENEM